jgi:hypothetical protein
MIFSSPNPSGMKFYCLRVLAHLFFTAQIHINYVKLFLAGSVTWWTELLFTEISRSYLKNMFQIFLPKDFFARQGVFCSPYQLYTDKENNEAWQEKTGKKAKDIFETASNALCFH